MTWWQALLVALFSGAAGTILGAQLQARRERKAAVRASVIPEVTDFSDSAARWLERVRTAIKERDEAGPDNAVAFESADEAIKDGRRSVARLLPLVGGPTTGIGKDAVILVSCLEEAVEEIREWPPWERPGYGEDGDESELDDLTETERVALRDNAWAEDWETGIAEATLWADYAHQALVSFASTAARHIDPTARDRVRAVQEVVPKAPYAVRHPGRARKRRAALRRSKVNLEALREHYGRFRKVSTEYPHRVADAYGNDLSRAAAATDEEVAAKVAEWEQHQGLPVTDWQVIGRQERAKRARS